MKGLRILITILFIAGAGLYVLETQVLPGVLISEALVTINNLNPNPSFDITVPESGGFVRVYLKSGTDADIDITVRDSSGNLLVETTQNLGSYNFRFDTPVAGDYRIQFHSEPPDARIVVRAYQNDRRIVARLF